MGEGLSEGVGEGVGLGEGLGDSRGSGVGDAALEVDERLVDVDDDLVVVLAGGGGGAGGGITRPDCPDWPTAEAPGWAAPFWPLALLDSSEPSLPSGGPPAPLA